MNTIKQLVSQIKKETGVNPSENITLKNNCIIMHNTPNFDFGQIFIIDLRLSSIDQTNFVAIGTSEDNNIHIPLHYHEILKPYYATYTNDQFILHPWQQNKD